jgi:heme A synthase
MMMFGVAAYRSLFWANGSVLRMLSSTALVAVILQGLLGGFRVKLNELVGTDLAAVHGVFAQIVLSLLVLLTVLTERAPKPIGKESNSSAKSLGRWAIGLTALVFLQIVWGAIIRHDPTPLMQRLHFLTAFLAVAMAILLLRAVFANPVARSRIGFIGWILCGLFLAQIYLGVEAWMMKFGVYMLPELVPITPHNATIRTLHALIGSGILISSLTLAARLRRTTQPENPKQNPDDIAWSDRSEPEARTVEIAASFRGNMQ